MGRMGKINKNIVINFADFQTLAFPLIKMMKKNLSISKKKSIFATKNQLLIW